MIIKMFRKWFKNKEGAAAIEFSLVAVPFIFTCIALIELSMFLASGALLESAVQDAARLVKTGQLQQEGGSAEASFKLSLCDRAGALLDCDKFQYQVLKLDDFDDNNVEMALDDDGNMVPPELFQVDQITAGCVGLVRVSYPFTFFTPLFGALFSNYPNNVRVNVSTVAFQTEPYNFIVDDPTCSI